MDIAWRTILWRQFGAALDMFENAMRGCPDELWRVRLWGDHSERPELSEFWYVAFHTLFWLDLYLSGTVEGFIRICERALPSSETRVDINRERDYNVDAAGQDRSTLGDRFCQSRQPRDDIAILCNGATL